MVGSCSGILVVGVKRTGSEEAWERGRLTEEGRHNLVDTDTAVEA